MEQLEAKQGVGTGLSVTCLGFSRDLPNLISPLKAGTFTDSLSQPAIPPCVSRGHSQSSSMSSSTAQQFSRGAGSPDADFCPLGALSLLYAPPVTQMTSAKQDQHCSANSCEPSLVDLYVSTSLGTYVQLIHTGNPNKQLPSDKTLLGSHSRQQKKAVTV